MVQFKKINFNVQKMLQKKINKILILHFLCIIIFLFIPFLFTPPHPLDFDKLTHRENFQNVDSQIISFPLIKEQIPPSIHNEKKLDNIFNYLIIQKIFFNLLLIIVFYINILYLYKKYFIFKKYFFWGFINILIGIFIIFIPQFLFGKLSAIKKPVFLLELEINVFLWILILIISIVYKEYNKIEEIKKQHKEMELETFRLQLNPHFLFNSLNTIYSLSLHKSEKTPNSILYLSSLMRYVLTEANKPMVKLKDELIYIDNFIDLQKLRFENNIDLIYNKKEILDEYFIAPMLLIPFIENAFKFSINNNITKNRILVDIEIKDKNLFVKIENNYQINKIENSTKIGIQNSKKRLELLYPNKHILKIEDNGHLFFVFLKIQLI